MPRLAGHSNPWLNHPSMKKSELPRKICPVCRREFAWRKKWSRDWDKVIYCSEACRKGTPRGKMLSIDF